jgi:3'(2'), 5'-bisphosphate nucleotidase
MKRFCFLQRAPVAPAAKFWANRRMAQASTSTNSPVSLAWAFAAIASQAGVAIMAVYETAFDGRRKADGSPVTDADEAAEAIIIPAVRALLPNAQIVAEEQCAASGAPRSAHSELVLIDPLDGTKEFLARNGEFTVNIALVRHGAPVLGCIYAPARARLWVGGQGLGAWAGQVSPGAGVQSAAFQPIAVRRAEADRWRVAASRSHAKAATDAFLSRMPGPVERREIGSSLKLCLLAEGEIDLYPRFGPVMEWDIAAGHAILEGAGGRLETPAGEPVLYGRADRGFEMAPFIAWGAARLDGGGEAP